jgi:hypothetical protein
VSSHNPANDGLCTINLEISLTPAEDLNPISTRWLRDTLYTCDGFSAIRYFPLLFKIGNGNVTIQGFIKQYIPVLFETDDGNNTIQGFSFTWVFVTLPYITSYLHA